METVISSFTLCMAVRITYHNSYDVTKSTIKPETYNHTQWELGNEQADLLSLD